MEGQQSINENEIDLMGYIKILIKRSKFIFSFFLIVVIVTGLHSLTIPKTYKATTMIMVTPTAIQNVLSTIYDLEGEEKNDSSADGSDSPWNISIPTHTNLLKSNLVLQRTIERLNLKDAAGKDISIDDLSKNLNIKLFTGENVVQLDVTDKDPQEARNIANAWAEEYVKYSQELVLGEVNGNGDFIMTHFENSQKSLFQAEGAVNDFKKEYNQDLMNTDLAIKKATLNKYKNEIAWMGLDVETQEDNLNELKKQIIMQDEFIVVSKAITDDALWQESSQKDDVSELEKKGLRSQIINPIYQDLEMRIVNGQIKVNTLKAREEYLNRNIEFLTEDIKKQDDYKLQKDFELALLTSQVKNLKESYDVLSNKVEEERIIKTAQLSEVKIVSPASTPNAPVSQGKMKRVGIAGIFSLILGIFLAFMMECWQKVNLTAKT